MRTKEISGKQKFWIVLSFFFAALLILTSGESISMTFSFDWPMSLISHGMAIAMMALASYGLLEIKRATSETGYEQNRPLILIKGFFCFLFGVGLSVAGSIHNLHYRMTNDDLQKSDIDLSIRELTSVQARQQSTVAAVLRDFERKVDAAVRAYIDECRNPENMGCGGHALERKSELDQILGVTIQLLSGSELGAPPTPNAIYDFKRRVDAVVKDRFEEIEDKSKELDALVQSDDFKKIVVDLRSIKKNFDSQSNETVVSTIRRAFSMMAEVKNLIEILYKSLGVSSDNLVVGEQFKRPASIEIRNVSFFWREALFSSRDHPVVRGDALFWSILFGVLFELAFVMFFYAGLGLGSRQE